LQSPNGTETSLDPEPAGTLIEVSFTPPSAGAYTLKFTVTDDYGVAWDTSLNFSVGKDDNPSNPDDTVPDDPDVPGNSGGGGGCSAFGVAGFLALTGILARKK
jgi:hypothetical protein